MLRVTAIGAGAVEYLVRGSGCAAHESRAPEGVDSPGYYEKAVAAGEPAGYWFGSGMAGLGLPFTACEVASPGDVRAVFGQLRHPDSSVKNPVFIGSRPRNYLSAEERVERAIAREKGSPSAERVEEIRRAAESDGRRSVAYYDWTFSAPKSVSVYYAALLAAGAVEDAEKVRAAHGSAVEAAVSFADARVAVTRTGRHSGPRSAAGMGTFEQGSGTTWSLWSHSTSRADEPQLHTHAALLNRTVTSGGKIGALDGASFAGIKQAVDAVYQQALEQEVSAATGVGWRDRADGLAREIAGVDESLLASASTRRGQVVARAEVLSQQYRARSGREPSVTVLREIAQTAVFDTRAPKSADAGPVALERWARERAEELRGSLSSIAEAAAGGGRGERLTRDGLLAGAVERVSALYAVWDIGNLMLAVKAGVGDRWADLGLGAASAVERAAALEGWAREAVGRADVVQVSMTEPAPVPDELRRDRGARVGADGSAVVGDGGYVLRGAHRERYTSAAHLGREEAVVARVSSALDVGLVAEKTAGVRAELDELGLSADQVQAVLRVLTSRVAADVVVGPAGAGKSRTMSALAQVWSREVGGRVLGVTTSQIAANNLADAHIDAINTAVFGGRFTPGSDGQVRDRLGAGDLVVVDEAGMTSTADLDLIMRVAAGAGAKVVLTGDPEQLGAVGAGGLFSHLVEHASSVTELQTVHRFAQEWERAASLQVRGGDTAAVAAYLSRGRLHAGTVEEMEAAAARAWLADTVAGRQSLLIVGGNEQAAQLSERLREELVRLGRVQAEPVGWVHGVGPGGQVVSVGDRVQARFNDRSIRVDLPAGARGGHRCAQVTNREVYTIVGEARDDRGDHFLLGRDGQGVTAYFPAAYAAQYLRLAYAGTVHAAQSLTVDTGHAVIGEGMGRDAVYPAITRGRVENHVWLVAARPADAHDPQALAETARSRFSSVIEFSGAQTSAVAARAEAQDQVRSLVTLAGDWFDLARMQHRERADRLLTGALGAVCAARVVAEGGRGSLLTVLAEAELEGHDPARLLSQVAGSRELDSAENVSDVLRWRIAGAVSGRVPEDPVTAATVFESWTVTGDGVHARQRNRLAPLIVDRIGVLGRRAAEQAPGWAVEALGAVPGPGTGEWSEWVRRAGVAAGYREYSGIADTAASLGPAPAADDVYARAWWTRAVAALGVDAALVEHRRLPDAVLAEKVQTWERVHAGAPIYAAEQLWAAHERLHDARVNAHLAAAARDNPTGGAAARELAEINARTAQTLATLAHDQVETWTAAHERRTGWYTGVRDLAEDARHAAEELHRRGRSPVVSAPAEDGPRFSATAQDQEQQHARRRSSVPVDSGTSLVTRQTDAGARERVRAEETSRQRYFDQRDSPSLGQHRSHGLK
ncbi:Conjugal transfer protein TraA [Pseudonocardia sp. Ae406_Ps2]|uniref:MobF family relaxase n=2 Tax=Pseudonocardia TaxID=1847 RepID=UPI00094ACA56|nr:MobF family relaxase [Pseudonocardia sp. Ae406_Ps2]OLL89961.1 Conjugal transfer protein TraA [Pseudonocardia sp. Ae406_Ps2]